MDGEPRRHRKPEPKQCRFELPPPGWTVVYLDAHFEWWLGLFDLADLLAEEYGERCFTSVDADDLTPDVTLAELIELLTTNDRA